MYIIFHLAINVKNFVWSCRGELEEFLPVSNTEKWKLTKLTFYHLHFKKQNILKLYLSLKKI